MQNNANTNTKTSGPQSGDMGQLGVAPTTKGQGAQSPRNNVFQSTDRMPTTSENVTLGVAAVERDSYNDYDEDNGYTGGNA